MLAVAEHGFEERLARLLARQAQLIDDRKAPMPMRVGGSVPMERRALAEQLWASRSNCLDTAIDSFNRRMAANKVTLHRRWTDNWGLDRFLERVEIGFSADETFRTDPRFLMFHIGADCRVHGRIGTAASSHAKEQSFRLDEAHEGRWTLWLLDFVELNIFG